MTREGRTAYETVSQNVRHNRSCSSVAIRSDSAPKMPFSNHIVVESGPGRMLKKPAGSIIALAFEVFLCVVALCFIALALAALCIRNRPTGDSFGSAMEQAMRLGPTIYPIMFAALLSRSLKSLGRYSAQRSVKMSTLWALMNTNATADPILHLLNMPMSLLVWSLLILWAMSPLGGQSTIRLMYKANLTDITHPELRYWDNGPLGSMFTRQAIIVGNDGSWPLSMRDLYLASLMQSNGIKAGPLDQWANIKIPRLETGNTSLATANGWMPLRNSSQIEDFTSLFGVPVIGLPEIIKEGDVGFSIETTYLELSCSPFSARYLPNVTTGLWLGCDNCFTIMSKDNWIRSQKSLGLPAEGFYASGLSSEYPHPDSEIDPKNPNYTLPRTLRLNSTFGGITSSTGCQVTQRHVEAYVDCIDQSCAATKIRESTTDNRNKNFTVIDYWAWKVFEIISVSSRGGFGTNDVIWGSSSSELFLNDSRTAPIQTGIGGIPTGVNMSTVNLDLFTTRLSILLNTGVQALMAPTGFAGDLPSDNLTFYGASHIPINGLLTAANATMWERYDANSYLWPTGIGQLVNSGAPFIGASSNATLTRYTEVYKPEYAWVVILIVSTAMLLVIGVAGILVRLKTLAPNMFDPVIGLTYSNPYISLTGRDDNPLDADDRAHLLGDKRVQLGQVDDYKGVKAVFGEAGYVTPLRLGVPYH
ncbi:hypothetical protein BJX63DRAFT_433537 [Aspergillus granulosus]|uniref:Uncharacterized protein n=1 Tax=Aspergillus granulosus TaxID=176169 RepID=A0ABR4H7D6_9EURO